MLEQYRANLENNRDGGELYKCECENIKGCWVGGDALECTQACDDPATCNPNTQTCDLDTSESRGTCSLAMHGCTFSPHFTILQAWAVDVHYIDNNSEQFYLFFRGVTRKLSRPSQPTLTCWLYELGFTCHNCGSCCCILYTCWKSAVTDRLFNLEPIQFTLQYLHSLHHFSVSNVT